MQVTINEDTNTMIIEISLQPPTPSKSGKTKVIASTHGNVQVGTKYQGKEITLGLNAYIKD